MPYEGCLVEVITQQKEDDGQSEPCCKDCLDFGPPRVFEKVDYIVHYASPHLRFGGRHSRGQAEKLRIGWRELSCHRNTTGRGENVHMLRKCRYRVVLVDGKAGVR